MRRQSELQDIALSWIRRLPPGMKFRADDIYKYLAGEHGEKVRTHQVKSNEPRFKYDTRWAIQTAKAEHLIDHLAHDEWERRSLEINIEL
jgi:hypothetical protein